MTGREVALGSNPETTKRKYLKMKKLILTLAAIAALSGAASADSYRYSKSYCKDYPQNCNTSKKGFNANIDKFDFEEREARRLQEKNNSNGSTTQ